MRTTVENWREDAHIGHAYEPSEVTVQLDVRGRTLGEPAAPVPQESSDGPVFVDESGRRSKKFRRVGWLLAVACACYAITLVAALLGGNSAAPLLPGLVQDDEERTDTVQIQPDPSGGATAGATPGSVPGAPTPTDSTGALLPQPSNGASTGIAGGTSAAPGPGVSGSAAPKPTGGGTRPGGTSISTPPGGGGSDPGPEPETSPSLPTPSDPGPSGNPTEPPVQEGAL
ncbi:hypothetical protein AB0F96_29495 [Streptomyces sp. NPDC023998]|uniref:hypothetical protein n=1 Tax=Streptomyces sp. NPDC023998 TaxID=3154597 RepID=UPI0033EBA946